MVERFEVVAGDPGKGCLDLVINYCQKEIIVKRSSLLGENFRALMISYSKIGEHVLTPFLGHKSG